jgi:hypothetical protein
MTDLEKKVLDAIAARKVTPRPAYVFLAKRSVSWALAAVAILMGAISFALLLFVVTDYYMTGLRQVDNMPLDEFLPVVPLLWLSCLILFLIGASYGLRHTARGYRHTVTGLLAMSLAASLGLGAILHVSGSGHWLHETLEEQFPSYQRLTHVPFEEWSRPDAGRLGGTVVAVNEGRSLTLLDFKDVTWIVDISGADIRLDKPFLEEGDIAITGTRTGPAAFRAATVAEFD